MTKLVGLNPVFTSSVLIEIRRVFAKGTHVKDVTLTFGITRKWNEMELAALTESIMRELPRGSYQREVDVRIPFPDDDGQLRLFIFISNKSNASGQRYAPK